MRRGARSFVQKPWDNHALIGLLTREIDDARAARARDARHLRDEHDARQIQRSLLPQTLPSLTGCEVAAAWRPASGFGGDCYDALAFGDDLVGLSIADVAGKGLSAALLMSNFQAAVRAFARPDVPPSVLCGNVNRLLCGHMVSGRFITCCYLQVDGRARTVTYANAGHNPPLLLRADGGVETLSTGGTVLGVFAGSTYAETTIDLRTGDRLLLYTDGITEALNAGGHEFGTDRLMESALRDPGASAAAMTARIMSDLLDFTAGSLQDDATVMSLVVGDLYPESTAPR
jgi:sigma-B regulation protein RsbU (phosphoserine phosphatase)